LMAAAQIKRKYGISYTRSKASAGDEDDIVPADTESACSIVAQAAKRLGEKKLSESAINKIWERRKFYRSKPPWVLAADEAGMAGLAMLKSLAWWIYDTNRRLAAQ